MSEPLPEAIKMLNQRLLAEGYVSAGQANEIWDNDLDNYDKGDTETLKKAFSLSNRQLAFAGMEIRGVLVDDSTYYAIVNKQPDDIAKAGFHSAFAFGTTEVNFVRLILEKLSEGPVTKANLINMKNSLKGNDNLTMDQAVAIVERMVRDGWIWGTTANPSKRRHSMQSQLTLAPRAYLELSYMLVDQFDMDKDELPQQIIFS